MPQASAVSRGFVLSVTLTEEEARRMGTSLPRIAQALQMQLAAMLPAATAEVAPLTSPGRPTLTLARPAAREEGLVIDLRRLQARVDGVDVHLSEREFDLLAALVTAGEPLSRDDLFQQVWGGEPASGERVVDVTIRRLRTRLGAWSGLIATVRGTGYRVALLPGTSVIAARSTARRELATAS